MQWNVELYDQQHAFVSKYGASLIELLQPQRDEKILDLGCGTGDLANQLFLKGCDVTGIDASQEMIDEATEKYPGIRFLCTDARDFDLREETGSKTIRFDAVFSNAALHWIKDPDAVLSRVFIHLKPGGRFVAEFGAKGNVDKMIKAIRRVLSVHNFTKQAAIVNWYYPSVGEYANKLEQDGFRIRFIESYDRPTILKDTENGIVKWLEMFGDGFFKGIEDSEKSRLLHEIQDCLYDDLFQQDKWVADYRRLRFWAVKR